MVFRKGLHSLHRELHLTVGIKISVKDTVRKNLALVKGWSFPAVVFI